MDATNRSKRLLSEKDFAAIVRAICKTEPALDFLGSVVLDSKQFEYLPNQYPRPKECDRWTCLQFVYMDLNVLLGLYVHEHRQSHDGQWSQIWTLYLNGIVEWGTPGMIFTDWKGDLSVDEVLRLKSGSGSWDELYVQQGVPRSGPIDEVGDQQYVKGRFDLGWNSGLTELIQHALARNVSRILRRSNLLRYALAGRLISLGRFLEMIEEPYAVHVFADCAESFWYYFPAEHLVQHCVDPQQVWEEFRNRTKNRNAELRDFYRFMSGSARKD